MSINLTNHFFDSKAYEDSLKLLEKYHKTNNSLIITNDELAKQVRKDFPKYELKASIIKNINSIKLLDEALEVYDYITLPMDKNDDDEFLKQIQAKDRVILFANAACAYNCPDRTCYLGFSQQNRGEKPTSFCSKGKIKRKDLGYVYFDVDKLSSLGFNYFKLIPQRSNAPQKIIRLLSQKKTEGKAPAAIISSYPKSGRTWIRFILANYLNKYYQLGTKVDLYSFFSILPNDDDNDSIKGIGNYRYHDRPEVPFILFSHKGRHQSQQINKRILIIRSPFDTLVSDYFQMKDRLSLFKGTISEFIKDSEFGVKKMAQFLNSWSNSILEKKLHIIQYEELSQDTERSIKSMLEYLNLPVDQKILSESVSISKFESMRKLETKQGMPSENYNLGNQNALRMREGKINGYQKHLSKEDVVYIRSYLNSNLLPNLRNFLKSTSSFADL